MRDSFRKIRPRRIASLKSWQPEKGGVGVSDPRDQCTMPSPPPRRRCLIIVRVTIRQPAKQGALQSDRRGLASELFGAKEECVCVCSYSTLAPSPLLRLLASRRCVRARARWGRREERKKRDAGCVAYGSKKAVTAFVPSWQPTGGAAAHLQRSWREPRERSPWCTCERTATGSWPAAPGFGRKVYFGHTRGGREGAYYLLFVLVSARASLGRRNRTDS